MTTIKKITFAVIITFLIIGCKSESEKVETSDKTKQEVIEKSDFSGNYVDDSYQKRNEGYDWVAVSVKQVSDDEIWVSVRSRADQKKPTCTFDATAHKVNDTTYSTIAEGKKVLITFTSNSITIDTEKPEDEAALYFFCSGGATIAGTYKKINEPLDQTQIDKTTFSKVLRLQDVGFNITAKPLKEGQQELEIYPFGLSLEDNQTVKQTIEGSVKDAEVEDLNSDGFPEVIVYLQSGDNKKGNVVGCSVISEKSMVPFYFPPITNNEQINQGYNGHDEFSVVETSLSQRFPIFENGKETGKIRQIQYKMEKGENLPVFVVKDIIEFDKK